jgi:hypothetical protein
VLTLTFPKYQAGAIANTAASLFQHASNKPQPSQWVGFPREARDLIACLMRGRPFDMARAWTPDPIRARDDGRVVVGCSGGKDSVAAALKLQAQGMSPTLFHVRGINRSFPDEWKAAQRVSESLGMPLAIVGVQQKGVSHYTENPAKNQTILGLMTDYGARSGIAAYGQGNMTDHPCSLLNFDSGWSDGLEMYDGARKLYGSMLEGFRYVSTVKNDTDSILTIAKLKPSAFQALQSCFMPLRYKGKLRETNERKFGISLLPGRCGSCRKCGSEYLHLYLLGLAPWNEAFAEHSIKVMQKHMHFIFGAGREYTRAETLRGFIDMTRLPAAARLL